MNTKFKLIRILKSFTYLSLLMLCQACCTTCDEPIEESNIQLVADYMGGLQIENGNKQTGTPPLSTQENLQFTITSNGYAFNNEGFDFTINTDVDLAGCYLQIKKGDAISEDFYILQFKEETGKISKNSIKTSSLLMPRNKKYAEKKLVNFLVNTSFADQLSLNPNTGTFGICFLISIFDSEGNISSSKEVCFNHHSWGNNFALSGLWNLTKYEERENNELNSVDLGQLVCDDDCYALEFQDLIFSDDGSFNLEIIEYEYEGQNLNQFVQYQESYEGKWFMDSETNELVLAVYNYRALEDNTQVEIESLSLGNAEIIVIPEVELLPDEFQPNQINFIYDDTFTEYYEKFKDL